MTKISPVSSGDKIPTIITDCNDGKWQVSAKVKGPNAGFAGESSPGMWAEALGRLPADKSAWAKSYQHLFVDIFSPRFSKIEGQVNYISKSGHKDKETEHYTVKNPAPKCEQKKNQIASFNTITFPNEGLTIPVSPKNEQGNYHFNFYIEGQCGDSGTEGIDGAEIAWSITELKFDTKNEKIISKSVIKKGMALCQKGRHKGPDFNIPCHQAPLPGELPVGLNVKDLQLCNWWSAPVSIQTKSNLDRSLFVLRSVFLDRITGIPLQQDIKKFHAKDIGAFLSQRNSNDLKNMCSNLDDFDCSPYSGDPVCGTDGQTYESACHATKKCIFNFSFGECTSKNPFVKILNALKNVVLLKNYKQENAQADFVCGYDKRTYKSAENAAKTLDENGKPNFGLFGIFRPCTTMHRDVDEIDLEKSKTLRHCGKFPDGSLSTFLLPYFSQRAGAKYVSQGACSIEQLNRVCYAPTKYCGIDGKEYTNKEQLQKSGVHYAIKGSCPKDFRRPSGSVETKTATSLEIRTSRGL